MSDTTVEYEIYLTIDPTKVSETAKESLDSVNEMYKMLTGEDIGLRVIFDVTVAVIKSDREFSDEEIAIIKKGLPDIRESMPETLRDTIISDELQIRLRESQ